MARQQGAGSQDDGGSHVRGGEQDFRLGESRGNTATRDGNDSERWDEKLGPGTHRRAPAGRKDVVEQKGNDGLVDSGGDAEMGPFGGVFVDRLVLWGGGKMGSRPGTDAGEQETHR